MAENATPGSRGHAALGYWSCSLLPDTPSARGCIQPVGLLTDGSSPCIPLPKIALSGHRMRGSPPTVAGAAPFSAGRACVLDSLLFPLGNRHFWLTEAYCFGKRVWDVTVFRRRSTALVYGSAPSARIPIPQRRQNRTPKHESQWVSVTSRAIPPGRSGAGSHRLAF